VDPGGVADSGDEASGYFAIQIENIGSANITHVWFNASYPTTDPFGTGNPSLVDAGNFVVLSRNESATDFWFINAVEYNATEALVYIKDFAGSMPPASASYTYGRFHNASNEYFWMIDDATTCHNTGTIMRIGNVSHSKTQTGTTDFQNGAYTEITLTALPDNSFGYADITGGPLSGLCVAVSSNCQRVFFSRWNADEPFHLCSNVNYAFDYNETGAEEALVPGDSFAMGIKAYVPFGIPAGSSTGTITAIVNDAA